MSVIRGGWFLTGDFGWFLSRCFHWTVEVKMMKYDFLSRQQNLTMQSIFADESGTDSQVKMPGTPDCLFQANPFTCAGYRHVSFEECRKYKFLYF
jgi:hypothetical protein